MRSRILFAAVVLSFSIEAQEVDSRFSPARLLGVSRLAGFDPNLATNDDLEPLRRLIDDAKVVGLGETYHTSGGFYQMKHRIFRILVEEMGFRAFAMESYWEGGERTATYVQTCAGSAEQAVLDHIPVWPSDEYAALARWMCEWNRTHPNPADKVVFFGVDIQQPQYDGPGLIAFLERIGIPRSDPRSNGLNSCEGVTMRHFPGQIPAARHETCLASIAAIDQHLQTDRADIVQRTSQQDFDVAMLRAAGLRAYENSVYTIGDGSNYGGPEFVIGYNHRDAGMAYAFHAMRAMKAPNAKTVLWAANSHVARSPMPRGERPLGSHLAEVFGDDYVSFALAAFDTHIDFGVTRCGAVERTPGSIEDLLARHDADALLVDTRSRLLPRRTYTMGLDIVQPWRNWNGIIYLRHSPKMRPLLYPPCS